jgi:hypothetical protein
MCFVNSLELDWVSKTSAIIGVTSSPWYLVAVAVVTHSVTVAVDAWTNHHQDIDQAINKVWQLFILTVYSS